MDELGSILSFAALLSVAFHFSRRLREMKTYILPAASLIFINVLAGPAYLGAVVAWVVAVYIIARSKLPVLPLYVAFIALLFTAMRLGILGADKEAALPQVAIPLGFSFLMFQSIGFLSAVRRGQPLPPFLNYSAGALYFPTLVMGPFCSNEEQRSKIAKTGRDPWDLFWGYTLVAQGLFKYGVAAFILDPYLLGPMPLTTADPHGMHALNRLLLASIYFYANFSGFVDMVLGASRAMGIELPVNFKFPFLSISMADYWRHWHITLGQWFRENVFIPLSLGAGRREWNERWAVPAAGIVTFLLIGAWHGLDAKFILWSAINALLAVFVHFRSRILGVASTFAFILLVNGLFLADSIPTYRSLILNLFTSPIPGHGFYNLRILAFGIFMLGIFWALESARDKLDRRHTRANMTWAFTLYTFLFYAGFALTPNLKDFVYQGF